MSILYARCVHIECILNRACGDAKKAGSLHLSTTRKLKNRFHNNKKTFPSVLSFLLHPYLKTRWHMTISSCHFASCLSQLCRTGSWRLGRSLSAPAHNAKVWGTKNKSTKTNTSLCPFPWIPQPMWAILALCPWWGLRPCLGLGPGRVHVLCVLNVRGRYRPCQRG